MGQRLAKTVVMIGMMGAGKTAVGQALARKLDVPFLDSDAEIEEAAAMTIPEIFSRDGETFFRQKESQVISRLMEGVPGILSTGGGAWLAEGNRATIQAHGVAVWLAADLELLWQRVRHKETRPLLRTSNPKATLTQLINDRTPFYEMADLRVQADASFSVNDMANRVHQALQHRADLWVEEN